MSSFVIVSIIGIKISTFQKHTHNQDNERNAMFVSHHSKGGLDSWLIHGKSNKVRHK